MKAREHPVLGLELHELNVKERQTLNWNIRNGDATVYGNIKLKIRADVVRRTNLHYSHQFLF
jgi:hypothetical protein